MISKDAVVDAALALADADHWERVRMRDVAELLDCTLDDLRAHFREKEEIVDAWFDRADRAALSATIPVGTGDPFKTLVGIWLGALEPYRRVTREMILTRLEPGHLHHQLPSLLRISRTVQWLREAAGRRQAFVARALDETTCTAYFVTSFIGWLGGWTHSPTR